MGVESRAGRQVGKKTASGQRARDTEDGYYVVQRSVKEKKEKISESDR